MESNMLRLTDKYDDPMDELRVAATAVGNATRRVIERAVDNGPLGEVARLLFKPRIRRVEDPHTVVVTVEIPGAQRESLEVTLSSKNVLCVKGKGIVKAKRRTRTDTPPEVLSFERTLPLLGRELERDRATAYLESGLLTVTIPKKEAVKTSDSGSSEKAGIRAA